MHGVGRNELEGVRLLEYDRSGLDYWTSKILYLIILS